MHHMIADRLRQRIGAGNGLGATLPAPDYSQLAALLDDPKYLPYFFLGRQGPEFLFCNTKVMPGPIRTLLRRTSTSPTSSRTSSAIS